METENAKPGEGRKKKNRSVPLLILTALIAGGGFIAYLVLNPSLSTDNAMVERTKATVSTKMMGLITKITVKEGDFIDKGSLLLELDAAELKAQRDQAKANLAVAEENIGLSRVNRERLASDLYRARSQYEGKIISTEAYEHAEKALQSAEVDLALAIKRVDVAKAQLELVEATLGNTRIVSPFDAVVAKKWMNEGDVLQPGQPVLTLFDRHLATVTANFEETKIAQLKVGQTVEIRVDAYPGAVFHGKVSDVGTNTGNQFSLIPVNNAAGNFTKVTQRIPVKIDIDEPTDLGNRDANRLLPGMSALVDVKR